MNEGMGNGVGGTLPGLAGSSHQGEGEIGKRVGGDGRVIFQGRDLGWVWVASTSALFCGCSGLQNKMF